MGVVPLLRPYAVALVALILTGHPGAALAQEAPSQPGAQAKRAEEATTPAAPRRLLPPDSTTRHTLDLPGRQLAFKATAGSIPLYAEDGRLTAEMAYVAYQLEGADAAKRPVAFAFNGGPGSSSAWVHAAGFGPWRLSTEPAALAPSAPAVLAPNPETWLDFTDLVFIDPVGTGFSRLARATPTAGPQGQPGAVGPAPQAAPPPGGRDYHSVDGDADSVADMIARWLRRHQRNVSPKMLVGESYGGIRAPKVAHRLQTQHGAGIGALVLISPVMDFSLFRGPRHRIQPFAHWLPSIAAAAREAKGQAFGTRAELAEVEAYARGEFLTDLGRGPRDAPALERVVKRVAAYSGLSEATVRQYGGRIDEFIYIREANRAAQRQASGYDVSITGDDADPTAYFPRWDDPFAAALAAPLKGAMLDLYARLGWKTELAYHLSASLRWQWGNLSNGVESISQLQSALALDPKMRLLVTHGATDLRTPYFGSALLLEQLPGYADKPKGRVELKLYPGGHMHYSREASRKALRADVKALADGLVPGP
ncbi:MAG: peptidase S10 [Hyphomicrobiaceae bacterium]|nr:peptidase S10 [Hyphomicrobiaceae bacterium]